MCACPACTNSISGRSPQWGQAISSIRGSMRDRGGCGLVDQIAVTESLEGERRIQLVRRVTGDGRCKHMRGAWGRLETAGAPAAIDIQGGHRRAGDDG